MAIFTDQMGHRIELPRSPRRIVSLVPSQTELLYSLGLEEEVVGITKFCVHPDEWFRHKTRIGGTKNLHIDRIFSLEPDLVIANKEENVAEQVLELAQTLPVWVSDVSSLEQALNMIGEIGNITARPEQAAGIIRDIRAGFNRLVPAQPEIPAAYLIWKDPYMTVGGDTFISQMMAACGFRNLYGARERYPVTSPEELQSLGCELLLLSSEPYPFREKEMAALQAVLPDTRILLVDGEYFSWYGSRLLGAPDYFTQTRMAAGF